MKRRGPPETVEDTEGGEIVRIHAGTVRLTHRTHGRDRWAILLDPVSLAETSATLWLAPTTAVLEVVTSMHVRSDVGREVDPLRAP